MKSFVFLLTALACSVLHAQPPGGGNQEEDTWQARIFSAKVIDSNETSDLIQVKVDVLVPTGEVGILTVSATGAGVTQTYPVGDAIIDGRYRGLVNFIFQAGPNKEIPVQFTQYDVYIVLFDPHTQSIVATDLETTPEVRR